MQVSLHVSNLSCGLFLGQIGRIHRVLVFVRRTWGLHLLVIGGLSDLPSKVMARGLWLWRVSKDAPKHSAVLSWYSGNELVEQRKVRTQPTTLKLGSATCFKM